MRCRVANGAEPRAAVQRRCELPLKIPQFITIFHDSQVSKWIKICQNAQLGDCDICQNRSRPRSRYISDHLGPRLGLILLNWRPPEERSIKSFEFLRVTMGIPLPSVTYVFKKRLKTAEIRKRFFIASIVPCGFSSCDTYGQVLYQSICLPSCQGSDNSTQFN